MKATKEQIGYMADKINVLFDRHTHDEVLDLRQRIPFAKDQFVSFCWRIFHAAKIDCRWLYDSGLDDSHIETALKHILADYK